MGFEQQAYFIPFALTGPARFRAPPPPALTSARYTADYNEVKEKGALTGSTRTAGETDIANFWLDNPGNIWIGGLRAIAEQRVPNTGNRARLFALASMSVASAITTAWDSKRYYNLWRPITAIQEGDNDTNDATVGDPDWQPFTTTPPYPGLHVGCQQRERGRHEDARAVLRPGRHPVHAHEHRARRHQESADVRELHGGVPSRSSTCASFRVFISASPTPRRARQHARSRCTLTTITCGRV